ncbi:MAG TPA: GNAT family N-acetyltransferase [Acidimicrobiales bacterium]|nr:GNAT family N-acetyltransferase [Acidimicrobiales bacterium]
MTVIQSGVVPATEASRGEFEGFCVRPIEPSDADALVLFHEHLSTRSIQLRYFYPHLALQPAEVTHLTCVDGYDRVAYVVEHEGVLVAVGRYDRLDEHCAAEVAFVVADEFQHRGLGSMLLERLAETARRSGIGEFRASVLVDNSSMLAVFHGSGFPLTESRCHDVVELTMEIGPRWP